MVRPRFAAFVEPLPRLAGPSVARALALATLAIILVPLAAPALAQVETIEPPTRVGAPGAPAIKAFASADEARLFQDEVIGLIERVRPSVVALEITFPGGPGGPGETGGGSGAIIDADGIIVTSGHVGRRAGLPVRIWFADGSMTLGETLGQYLEGQADCGLVRFDPGDRELVALPLADEPMPVGVGDWILSFGHTHGVQKQPFRPAPVRIGRVTALGTRSFALDAPLNSGDSGGPVVDLSGRLVGINESASAHPDQNAATLVSVAIDRMDRMLAGESGGADLPDPEGDLALGRGPGRFREALESDGRDATRRAAFFDQVFEDAVWDASDWAVQILADARPVALGTIVDEGLVFTKASEVRGAKLLEAVLPTGIQAAARVLAVDPRLDLALLGVRAGQLVPVDFTRMSDPPEGAWVVSVGVDARPISFGIRSLTRYDSALEFIDRPFLGVRFAPVRGREARRIGIDAGARVEEVIPATAARHAGLRVGDVIVGFDGEPLRPNELLRGALDSRRVGDVVSLSYLRDEESFSQTVRLGARPGTGAFERSGNGVVKTSRVSSGFGPVVQHDGLLESRQCGGPLVDLDGRFVGINIARADRTRNFALPAEIVREALARMRTNVRPDDAPIVAFVEPRFLMVPIEADADARYELSADAAMIDGPSVAMQARGELSVDGLRTPDDVVRWVVSVDDASAYRLYVSQSCPHPLAGQHYVISVDGVSIDAVVEGTSGPNQFKAVDLGEIRLPAGERVLIEVHARDRAPASIMRLQSLTLVPVVD